MGVGMRYVGIVIDDWCWEVEDPMELMCLQLANLIYVDIGESRLRKQINGE